MDPNNNAPGEFGDSVALWIDSLVEGARATEPSLFARLLPPRGVQIPLFKQFLRDHFPLQQGQR